MDTPLNLQIAVSAQLALGFVFGSASVTKIRSPRSFTRDVAAYELLPPRVSSVLALVLIVAEFFLAIAFLSGWAVMVALPVSLAILLTFLLAVSINLKRRRRIACGCFGDRTEEISPRSLARLILLLALVVGLLTTRIAGGALPSLWHALADGTSTMLLGETIFAAVFLIIAGAWVLHLPELLDVARGIVGGSSVHDEPLEKSARTRG